MRDSDKAVKQSEMEIDLETDGILQEAILSDKQHMKEIHDKVEELKDESKLKRVREDLKTENLIFSEETRREMGSMEICEFKPMTATTQCHSCSEHVPEGLRFCKCGTC